MYYINYIFFINFYSFIFIVIKFFLMIVNKKLKYKINLVYINIGL